MIQIRRETICHRAPQGLQIKRRRMQKLWKNWSLRQDVYTKDLRNKEKQPCEPGSKRDSHKKLAVQFRRRICRRSRSPTYKWRDAEKQTI